MKARRSARWVIVTLVLLGSLLTPPGAARAQGFDEQFSSPVLDPAWTVVPGIRVASGFPPPANDFSLTANPGHLRYTLNAMTHADGFLNGYQPTFGEHSCCTHDPGLELHRTFGGTDWLLETKVDYHMPFANGRDLALRIYFGDGSVGTFGITMGMFRDIGNSLAPMLDLFEKTGPRATDRMILESGSIQRGELGATSDFTNWFQVERAGGVLTAMWSADGVIWTTAWSHDFGTALDGLDQRVVITGLSWFVPAGSFADYDYITVTQTNNPPDCSTVTASPDVLWPPNHKLRLVSLSGATDPDGDPVTLTMTGVTQDEPVSGLDADDLSPDAQAGARSDEVMLRAERSDEGDGRVYRIAFDGSDGRGGTCSGTATVGVPRDQGEGSTPIDSAPPSYDSFGP